MKRREFIKALSTLAVIARLPLKSAFAATPSLVLPQNVMRHGWKYVPATGVFVNPQLTAILIEHAKNCNFKNLPPMLTHHEYGVSTRYIGKLSNPPKGTYEQLLWLADYCTKNNRKGEIRAAIPRLILGYGGCDRQQWIAWYAPNTAPLGSA